MAIAPPKIQHSAPAAAALALALTFAGLARAEEAGTVSAPLSTQRLLAAAVVGPHAAGGAGGLISHAYAPSRPQDIDAPRTQIDRRLSGDGLTGSLGYLCGIDSYPHEQQEARGPASSYGRESTFLGAKLSYAFH
jgi:hypothetical protein